MSQFIPVHTPQFSGKEKQYLCQCIDEGWVSSEGSFVAEFENKMSSCVKRKYGIAVSNGSLALEIAVQALGIGQKDEVILPSFTIISCINAIIKTGATPILVDSFEDSWNINWRQVEQKITSATKAILVPHMYGHPAEMNEIINLAKEKNLLIIEDAAQMHGQYYEDKPCGSFGVISCFSFYANKLITTGEGGMLVTDSSDIAERCRYLRNQCFDPGRRFVHSEIGGNARMSNIQAAIGVAQLEQLEDRVAFKRRIGKLYNQALAELPGIQLPLVETNYSNNIYWAYGVLFEGRDAEEIALLLKEKGIGTRPFFWPLHMQPVFKKMFEGERFPVSEKLAKHGLYLPGGFDLSEKDIKYIAKSIKEILL